MGGGNTNPPPSSDSVYSPADPQVPATIGFFESGWKAKTFTALASDAGPVPSVAATDALTIDINKVIVKVPAYVYGNNSNLWSGQIITQPT